MSDPPAAPDSGPGVARAHHRRATRDTGPGILETSLVLGLSILVAVAIIAFFGGQLADVIGVLVDAASGVR